MSIINQNCDTVYNGVLLSSYLWIIVSAILFQILNFFVTEYFIPYSKDFWQLLKAKLKTKKKESENQNENQNPNQKKGTVATATVNATTTVAATAASTTTIQRRDEYSAGLSFLWYQILVSYYGFIAACVIESNQATSDVANFWEIYQNIYGMYINTVALTPIISILFFLARFGVAMLSDRKIKWELDFPEEAEKVLKQMGFLSYLPLVPAIYTHIIPGLFIFAWLPILLLFLFVMYCILGYFLYRAIGKAMNVSLHKKLVVTAIQLGFRVCLMILFQSLYNYMYIFYDSDHSYNDAIALDYGYRTQSTCIFNEKVDSMKSFFQFITFM